ncbi:MAG: hypothetical protein GQ559_08640 [Desulfobulbaceae bacterium]|nr:hypothetical protein [Desulfobulbaceae bacterium]
MIRFQQPKSSHRLPRFLSVLLPLIGFLLILAGMNVYQYFRVKTDLASSIIQQISDREFRELQSFSDSISSKLNIVRDWGKNGVLNSNDIVSQNKKLFPLIEHQAQLSGLLLADESGNEYYLYSDGEEWVTRVTTPGKDGSHQSFQRWQSPDTPKKTWEKDSSYDARKRPWYHSPQENNLVHWTPVYTFFESKKEGVTASVAWKQKDDPAKFMVFGLDINLQAFQTLLTSVDGKRPGILFLVNPHGNYFITEDRPDAQSAENNPDYKAIVAQVAQQWSSGDQSPEELMRLQINNAQWLASFKPLRQKNRVFWLGLAAPEKELLTELKETLFSVDLTDLLVAVAGGLLLFALIWRTGGLRKQEAPPPAPVVRLHNYINQGEGSTVEFKSTVRTNLKTGKQGKEIELAWLKAVIAFLNSEGGALLIGVADSGEIVGIGVDNFENSDRCQLHLKNLINHHIGAEFSGFIQVTIVASEDQEIVLVECEPAGDPVFLKIGKNEEFYIRSGPSSIKLLPSQMISYVLQNRK